MPEQQLQTTAIIAQREGETRVVRNVGIPTSLPPAERVVSANARVEITDVDVEFGAVIISGIIRSTIFYASADDPANVVSIRQNFRFTDRIAVSGARPGQEAEVDALISDIDFYLINDRQIGIEFTVVSEINLYARETVPIIRERPGVEIRRQRFTIRRQLRERNYTRELEEIVSLPRNAESIRQIVDVNASPQVTSTITSFGRITVRGNMNNEVLYNSTEGNLEATNLRFSFAETFSFSGVTPDEEPFVEITVLDEDARLIDSRRVQKTIRVNFRILVVQEETIEVPTGIITPGVFPIRRTVLVERVVAEERRRISARDTITVPTGNPDVGRVIRATGRLRGGSLEAEASTGGVVVSGVIDANIIYAADLPTQPVYFAPAAIPFSSFVQISGVTPDMEVIADAVVERTNASRVSNRQISVSSIIEVNLLVTELVRVPVVTEISDVPVEEEEEGFITYTVQSGDTLYLISRRFGVSINRLIQLNNITNPNQLQVGQQLLIPRGG